jgi:hypothetical protein
MPKRKEIAAVDAPPQSTRWRGIKRCHVCNTPIKNWHPGKADTCKTCCQVQSQSQGKADQGVHSSPLVIAPCQRAAEGQPSSMDLLHLPETQNDISVPGHRGISSSVRNTHHAQTTTHHALPHAQPCFLPCCCPTSSLAPRPAPFPAMLRLALRPAHAPRTTHPGVLR